jgi:hypothetical protein
MPYGWLYGETFAALAFGEAMAWAPAAAAAGGYDIPAGVNPVTQLHSQEMVLPADIASNVRNMTGGGGNTNINITALDTKSFMSREGRKVLKSLSGSSRRLGIRR